MVSPRPSATIPMDTVPSAITAAHSSLFWIPLGLMATSVIGFPPPPAATTAPANSSTGRSSRPAVDIIFDRLTRFRFDRDQTAAGLSAAVDGLPIGTL